MIKYLLLYNIYECEEDIYETSMINKIIKAIPEAKILNYGIYLDKIDKETKSIWVPEDKFLIAWTVANYENLLGISFYECDCEVVADDAIDTMKDRQEKESNIKYF